MNKKEVVQGFCSVFTYMASNKISFFEKFCVIGFVLAYIVSPVDLIPDVPVIGWMDDIGIGALFMAYCAHRINTIEQREQKKAEKLVIDVTPVQTENNNRGNTPAFFRKKKKESDDSFFTKKD